MEKRARIGPRAEVRRSALGLAVVACTLAATAFAYGLRSHVAPSSLRAGDDPPGLDLRDSPTHRPTVQAAFHLESYRPGDSARLRLFSAARAASIQIVRSGTEQKRLRGNDTMAGSPVTGLRQLGSVRPGEEIRILVGAWPSGLYFARLQAAGGRVGYAPFVLRPRRLGEHRVAVVLPTVTWQAYNLRDGDGDGRPDSWYGDSSTRTARLARPFENRGAPPKYRRYDQPFLRWLIHTGRCVDYLSDRDLRLVASGAALARAYDLIVFPGHHEYVTTHEYDVVTDFRDRGGNLIFLSANNFFARVDIDGDVMTRVGKWRDLGRPEAALIGVQYVDWNRDRYRSRPYIVEAAGSLAWIFAGTGLGDRDRFAAGGIEIDRRAASSPPGIRILATIPDVFGPGKTAEMTYYTTASGAKVFAAGAFTLAGSIWHGQVRRVVENLWTRLALP